MKLLRTVAVAAGLTASITILHPVQAQTQNAYQDYFQKYVEYQSALLVRKDMNSYFKTLTPDHVHINLKGKKRTLKQQKEMWPQAMQHIRSLSVKVKVGNVRVNGNTATATVSSAQTMLVWNAQLQRDLNFQAQGIEEYTFRRVNGKWLESSSRETMTKAWLEGREVPAELLGRS